MFCTARLASTRAWFRYPATLRNASVRAASTRAVLNPCTAFTANTVPSAAVIGSTTRNPGCSVATTSVVTTELLSDQPRAACMPSSSLPGPRMLSWSRRRPSPAVGRWYPPPVSWPIIATSPSKSRPTSSTTSLISFIICVCASVSSSLVRWYSQGTISAHSRAGSPALIRSLASCSRRRMRACRSSSALDCTSANRSLITCCQRASGVRSPVARSRAWSRRCRVAACSSGRVSAACSTSRVPATWASELCTASAARVDDTASRCAASCARRRGREAAADPRRVDQYQAAAQQLPRQRHLDRLQPGLLADRALGGVPRRLCRVDRATLPAVEYHFGGRRRTVPDDRRYRGERHRVGAAHRYPEQRVDQRALALLELARDEHVPGARGDLVALRGQPPGQVLPPQPVGLCDRLIEQLQDLVTADDRARKAQCPPPWPWSWYQLPSSTGGGPPGRLVACSRESSSPSPFAS